MNPTPPNQTPVPGRRRWVQVLLAASLTVNVLVLSVIAGAVLRDGRDHKGGRDHRKPPSAERSMLREGGLTPFFDAMSPDARARMAEAFRESGAGVKLDKAALAADFRAFISILRAEPFDPDALGAVLEAQHERVETRIVTGRRVLIDQIVAMAPDERAGFADALEARFEDALSRAPRKPGGPPSDK